VRSKFIFIELHLRTECQLCRLYGITAQYRLIISCELKDVEGSGHARLLIKMTSFEVGNLTYGTGALCFNIQFKKFIRQGDSRQQSLQFFLLLVGWD
jgi:hypothetical protein